jgi:hypothetical protein
VTSCSRASAGQGTGIGAVPTASRRTACSDSGRPASTSATPGQHHLAVLFHHALGERGAFRRGPAATEQGAQPGPCGAGAQDASDLAPGDVSGVGDDTGGLVHLAQQYVGVEQAEPGGDLVLFLQVEAVGGAPGGEVEGVADVEEGTAGGVESLAGGVGQPGGGDGAQRGGVAEAAVGLLEVGFEEEAQLTGACGAVGAQLAEFREAPGGLVAPVGEDGGAQAGGEGEVAGQVTGVEQAQLDLEVLGGGPAGLGVRADRVVEGEAEVPDRVPEAVRDGGDGGRVGAVVQEQQVEVAARGQLAASVAADGDQGHSAGAGGGGGEQAGQPAVGETGERLTAGRPGPGLLLEEAQPGRRVAAGSRVLGLFTRVRARHPATPVPLPALRGRPPALWGAALAVRPLRYVPCGASGPLQGVRSALTGADPHGGLDGDRPDLAVTDLAGAGGADHDLDELVGVRVVHQNLYADLGDQVHGVLGAPVDLGVAALTAVAARLRDGQTVHSEGLEGFLDLVELVRLDDRGDQLHASTLLLSARAGTVGLAALPPPTPLKS